MHLNFNFTAVQILWTLTFAAHLVLLVVLLGRDRARRFPWFTTAIALVALRLIASRLLFGRLPQLTLGAIFVILADVSAVVSFLVLVELARKVFATRGALFGFSGASCCRRLAAWCLPPGATGPRGRQSTHDQDGAVELFADVCAKGGLLTMSSPSRWEFSWSLWPSLRCGLAQSRTANHDWPLHGLVSATFRAGNLGGNCENGKAALDGRIRSNCRAARKTFQRKQRGLSRRRHLVDCVLMDR